MKKNIYKSLNSFLREKYGQKVWKVPVNAEFTCPNRDGKRGTGGCIYCNNESFSGAETGSIREQVKSRVEKLKKRGINKYIVYFQSYTNTYASVDELKMVIDEAVFDDGAVALHIGTRPDEIDEEKAELLAEYNKKIDVTVELGLQSAHDNTLLLINRGHTKEEFDQAFRILKKHGLDVCVHIIFGLPEESREDMVETVKYVSSLKADSVKFHHLHVVKDTKLFEMYENGEVELLTEEKYMKILAEALTILPEDTVVSRLIGDAAGYTLVAPKWPKSKSEFLLKLERYMNEHGMYQGSANQ